MSNLYIEKTYEDKTVLITGGAGAIGSNLARKLSELKAKTVIILDDMSAGFEWNIPESKNILFVKGSVTDEQILKRVFRESPEIVFHLAAFFANQNSVDYPERDLKTNALGTLKLLQYSNFCKVSRFVYGSSGASFYDSNTPLPVNEECMSLKLGTPYQISKMAGEVYCNFFNSYYGLNTVNLRYFNSYGPGEVPGQYRNVIPNFVYWALKGKPLPITGDGKQTRDFTYIDNIIQGTLSAGQLDSAIGQSINLASGKETEIITLANCINDLTSNSAGLNILPKRKWDNKDRRLSSTKKAESLMNYNPTKDLKEGLQSTIEWFKDNWKNIESSNTFPIGANSAHRG
tara:strand:- start:1562 stop:2596 length:1035 start_codon:yes stop_codon:yes gene_type:complete